MSNVADEQIVETGADVADEVEDEVVTPDGDDSESEAEQNEADSPPAVEENDDETESDDARQKRIAELAFENRQLKRQLEARQQRPESTAEAAPVKTLKDFDYDEVAFNDYLIDESSNRAEARAARRQQSTEQQRQFDQFRAEADAFDTKVAGFADKLFAESTPITQEVALHLQDADSDPEVRLRVAECLLKDDMKELKRIGSMNTVGQHAELLKIKGNIAKEIAKVNAEKTKGSKAPAPPKPIDGNEPGVNRKSPSDPTTADKMSDKEWIAARNKQIYGK